MFNITSSISSASQLKLSKISYANGLSSSRPKRTNVSIVSASPNVPRSSSKYFRSNSANFQCGDQPVTTIGSSLLYDCLKVVAIAPLDDVSTDQPSSSYSSNERSAAWTTPAPGSIPIIEPLNSSVKSFKSEIELTSSIYSGTTRPIFAPSRLTPK